MGAHYQRALVLYQQQRDEQALDELKKELAEEPNSAACRRLMALCETRRGNFKVARNLAEEGIRLAPDDAHCHYALAWVFYRDLKYVCRRGLIIAHDEASVRRKRFKLAEAELREALRLNPLEPEYHSLLGFVLLERKQIRPALDSALSALAINPHHVDALRLQAVVLRTLGEVEPAAQASERALESNPSSPHAHLTHGYMLLETGQTADALSHFQEALRLSPQLPEMKAALLDGMRCQYRIYALLWRLGWRRGHRVRTRAIALGKLLLSVLVVLAMVSIAMSVQTPHSRQQQMIRLSLLLPCALLLSVYPTVNYLVWRDPVGRSLFDRDRRNLPPMIFYMLIGSYIVCFAYAEPDDFQTALLITTLLCSLGNTFGNRK
jgi:tetratricopeptide (TPR) repeat protein